MSEHRDLYKNTSQLKEQQVKRRIKLLEEQKQLRLDKFSIQRDLVEVYSGNRVLGDDINHGNKNKSIYSKNLMLSEWMMTKPEDIEDFYFVPCPRGKRCTLSTGARRDNKAMVYYKNGQKFLEILSNLPPNTILDCIYASESRTVFVLDVISYGGRDFMDCDTSLRFFWISSKYKEDNLQFTQTDLKLSLVEKFDFADSYLIKRVVEQFTNFADGAKLDGYLFYHKEASYTKGESPLVLWLFPFMFDELFEGYKVNESHELERPIDYTDYLDYIRDFNEKLQAKKFKGKSKYKPRAVKMDLEHSDLKDSSDDFQNEMESMIELEKTGFDL